MNKLNCNIVQDLLPSYIDDLVSEQTSSEIKEHLSGCDKCSVLYAQMISGENIEKQEAKKEINYLRKIKSRNFKIIASIIAFVLTVVLVLIGVYIYYGAPDDAYAVSNINVTDKIMNAEISLYSSANGITKASAEEINGTVTINVRSSPFALKREGTKVIGLIADENISKIKTSDGRVIWENGEEISQRINNIYNAKIEYIGDNSGVNNLLYAINIHDVLKCESYAIHLLTDKRPYGLEIYDIDSYDELFSAFTNESYQKKIKSCAFIILACIENVDYVKFDYIAPDGTENTYKLTVDEANDYLSIIDKNTSIKEFSNDRSSLKWLIDSVEQQLITDSHNKYEPLLETTDEFSAKLNDNPIDKKYLDIQNNTPYFSVHMGNENYVKWAEAYERQYKIIYKALLDYAKNNPDIEDYIRGSLVESIKKVEDLCKYNDIIADLYYITEESAMGMGSMRESTYCRIYLNEAREKTLRLAELAYFLNVDFEWVE